MCRYVLSCSSIVATCEYCIHTNSMHAEYEMLWWIPKWDDGDDAAAQRRVTTVRCTCRNADSVFFVSRRYSVMLFSLARIRYEILHWMHEEGWFYPITPRLCLEFRPVLGSIECNCEHFGATFSEHLISFSYSLNQSNWKQTSEMRRLNDIFSLLEHW